MSMRTANTLITLVAVLICKSEVARSVSVDRHYDLEYSGNKSSTAGLKVPDLNFEVFENTDWKPISDAIAVDDTKTRDSLRHRWWFDNKWGEEKSNSTREASLKRKGAHASSLSVVNKAMPRSSGGTERQQKGKGIAGNVPEMTSRESRSSFVSLDGTAETRDHILNQKWNWNHDRKQNSQRLYHMPNLNKMPSNSVVPTNGIRTKRTTNRPSSKHLSSPFDAPFHNEIRRRSDSIGEGRVPRRDTNMAIVEQNIRSKYNDNVINDNSKLDFDLKSASPDPSTTKKKPNFYRPESPENIRVGTPTIPLSVYVIRNGRPKQNTVKDVNVIKEDKRHRNSFQNISSSLRRTEINCNRTYYAFDSTTKSVIDYSDDRTTSETYLIAEYYGQPFNSSEQGKKVSNKVKSFLENEGEDTQRLNDDLLSHSPLTASYLSEHRNPLLPTQPHARKNHSLSEGISKNENQHVNPIGNHDWGQSEDTDNHRFRPGRRTDTSAAFGWFLNATTVQLAALIPKTLRANFLFLRKLFTGCRSRSDKDSTAKFLPFSCFKKVTFHILDAAIDSDDLRITDAISLVKNNETILHNKNRSFSMRKMEENDWLPNLLEKIRKLFFTHSLKIRLTKLKDEDFQVESRRRHQFRRVFPVVAGIYMIITAVLIPLVFQFMAMMGGKSFVIGKIALLFALFTSFNKFIGGLGESNPLPVPYHHHHLYAPPPAPYPSPSYYENHFGKRKSDKIFRYTYTTARLPINYTYYTHE